MKTHTWVINFKNMIEDEMEEFLKDDYKKLLEAKKNQSKESMDNLIHYLVPRMREFCNSYDEYHTSNTNLTILNEEEEEDE